jgi:hypothetical protein
MPAKSNRGRLASRLLANWHQKVIALIAALFVFVFYRISTQREIRVPLDVKRPAGYELSREWPQDVTIVSRGSSAPQSLSEKDFKAAADLSTFTEGGTVKGAVKVVFLRDQEKDGGFEFDFSPSLIEFVLEPVLDKYVPVDAKAAVTGVLPPGYFIENLTFAPQNVLVRGPKSHVEKVVRAAVENFDLTGRKSTLTGVVKIMTNSAFVRPVDAQEVKITAVIKGRRTIENIGFVWNGLRSDLSVREAPRGSIEVEGAERALEALLPDALALAVDCRGVSAPGEYTLKVEAPTLPAEAGGELKLIAVAPAQVTLRFERKEGEGPP